MMKKKRSRNNWTPLYVPELESNAEIPSCSRQASDGRVFHKPVSVFNPTKREERAMRNPEVVERKEAEHCAEALNDESEAGINKDTAQGNARTVRQTDS